MDKPSPQHLAAAGSGTAVNVAPSLHEPMAFSILAACKVSGIGRTRIYEAIASGALCARKNGAKNLILRAELQRWLESLPTEKATAELLAVKATSIAGAAG